MRPHYDAPRQATMKVDDVEEETLQAAAIRAVELSRQYLPRATGAAAATLFAIWGEDWFGVEWLHDSIWFQESGIKPFTMRPLAGKVIPMWVRDADGKERQRNPRAETRVRADTGETEVLIFRRAAQIGQRKIVTEYRPDGSRLKRSVPASYPGAPGRIAVNRSRGLIRAGDIDPNAANSGWIARGNVGVRWRHPGLEGGRYLVRGMSDSAREFGIHVGDVRYLPGGAAYEGARYEIVLSRR